MRTNYETRNINGYKADVFTNYDGQSLYISDPDGFEIFAAKVSGDAFKRARQVVAAHGEEKTENGFDAKLLAKAVAQVMACEIALADGETDGAAKYKAVIKAADVIDRNRTIKFDGEKLTFLNDKGEQRTVSRYGCHTSCVCGNRVSYHKSLFAILHRYDELQAEATVRVFPARKTSQGERRAA